MPTPKPVLVCATSALIGLLLAGGCSSDPTGTRAPADAATAAGAPDATVAIDAALNPASDATVAPPTGPSPFAKPCETEADCELGLLCLQADSDVWLGGGPAHGYCSFDCTGDATVCAAFDNAARCLSSATMDAAYCFKGCTLGDTEGERKCAERQDISCAFIDIGTACLPNCGGDEDCPAGRYCDHTDGVCKVGSQVGDPPGTECDLSSSTTTCSAYCASLSSGEGVCSGLCVLGAEYACDVHTSDPALVGTPVCVSFNGNRTGDTGLCVQRCRCNGDCDHPSAYCDYEVPEATQDWGVCLFDFEADAGTGGVACAATEDAGTRDASVADGAP